MKFSKRLIEAIKEAIEGDIPSAPKHWERRLGLRTGEPRDGFSVRAGGKSNYFKDFDRARTFINKLFSKGIPEVEVENHKTGETATLNR